MADRVKVRRLSPAEGARLLRIVRRGESKLGGNAVRWRRATMILASAGGNSVPVIARLLVLGVALFEDGGVGFCDDGPGTKAPRGLFPAGRSSSA